MIPLCKGVRARVCMCVRARIYLMSTHVKVIVNFSNVYYSYGFSYLIQVHIHLHTHTHTNYTYIHSHLHTTVAQCQQNVLFAAVVVVVKTKTDPLYMWVLSGQFVCLFKCAQVHETNKSSAIPSFLFIMIATAQGKRGGGDTG